MTKLTESGLIEAVREALTITDDSDALTSAELCEALGVPSVKVWKILKGLGSKIECVQVVRVNITGRQQTVPAYRYREKSSE